MATSPTRADAATDGSFSDIDMEELDSYLTSPPVRRARAWRPSERVFARRFKIPPSPLSRVPRRASAPASPPLARSLTASPRPPPSFPQEMINDDGDDALRAAARARLAARAAHVEGGMAAQAAAEAAVEAAALDRAAAPRAAFARLDANAPIANAALTPAASTFGAKRKHIISPPMKVHRRKDNSGAAGVVVARAARDLCGDLGEPKEALMRRAIDVIGIVAANDLAIEVGRIEGAGGQMTSDGARRRTPGGVFWALLRAKTSKEDWDVIFEEEKEAQRERCRRRRRAQSLNNSLASSPTLRSALATPHGSGAFINQMGQMMNQIHNQTGAADGEPAPAKTPAARFAAAPAATAAQRLRAAPARPTMAERISGAAAANATAANADGRVPEESWAARMRRTVSAPAGSLDATMATEASSGSPPANQHAHSPGSPTVLTPDNDPSRAGAYAAAQGSYAARAKAAAEREAEEAAVRARALGLVAARRAAEAKLERTDAPEAANVDDQVMMDAEEAQEQGEAQEQAAPPPAPAAPAWGVSFAAALRA